MSTEPRNSRVTVNTLRRMKQEGDKIAVLTAYDASFARVLDESGIDVVLVGDSLGMVIQGQDTTVPVTMNDMIYHARSTERGLEHAMLVVDMPFMSYTSPEMALRNAARLMQEGSAQMVKLEGGEAQVHTVAALTRHGIPVCAHLGLTPQSVHKIGGYRVQGREELVANQMMADAISLQNAGADLLILECVPEQLAMDITEAVSVPVIGIGASVHCDGQVLVLHDILGISHGRIPKFARNFLDGEADIQSAVTAYIQAVKNSSFPTEAHTF